MSEKQRRYQRVAEHRSTNKDAEQTLLSEVPKKFDPKATTDDLIQDLRRIQKMYPERFITRRMYRTEGKYSDSTWDSRFGTFAEFRKQAGLELSRGQQTLERQIAKHASVDVYRGFHEVEVLPWVGKYAKDHAPGLKSILVGSDFHDLEVDHFCLAVFIDTARRVQPDIIVLNGDVFDLYEFSRFDKDPRQMDLKGRFDFVREAIFAPLREACPNAQIDLVLGNHEHRLLKHLAEKTPYMRILLSDLMGLSMADLFGLPKFKINLVCQWDLAAWTPAQAKSEALKNWKVYFDAFVVTHHGDEGFALPGTSGHTHRPMMKTWADHRGGKFWITTGAMATRAMEYHPGLVKAQQSFLLVMVDTHTKECIPEHVLFSRDTAMVGGKIYRRGTPAQEPTA